MSTFYRHFFCSLGTNTSGSSRKTALRYSNKKVDVLPLLWPRRLIRYSTSSTVPVRRRTQWDSHKVFSTDSGETASSTVTSTYSPLCAKTSTSNDGSGGTLFLWNTGSSATSVTGGSPSTGEILVGDDAYSRSTISTSDVREGNFASIRRTFGPNDNAQALLLCGGASLARHASFDPTYARAREWIRSHAVGPAVVEHILIQGLAAALVEAALPNRVPLSYQMTHHRPLIVGVEVEAIITVTDVRRDATAISNDGNDCTANTASAGKLVTLRVECKRVRDGTCVAEGIHKIWLPDT